MTKPHKWQKQSILTIWLTYIEWSFFRSECASIDVRQMRQNSTDQRHKIMTAITLIRIPWSYFHMMYMCMALGLPVSAIASDKWKLR